MKRLLIIGLALAAAVVVLVTGTAAGGDDGTYEVRGVFDNAAFLVKGEEVRVAGAKVGEVADVTVSGVDEPVRRDGSSDPGKAIVVMKISDAGFQDFRTDASCLIRPQSLIGEKFVECSPTQPRSPGTVAPPELSQIPDGEPGEGQYLLPLENNGTAIDLDLVNNIMKEPYPDRFRLILNSLGASFAARGRDLAEIIDRSNPALRETNKVLAVLAKQNKTLAQLSSDSDQVITALARKRENIGDFINQSNTVAAATAERSADLEETFARFPGFLRELQSTMNRLNAFSTTATPVFRDLGEAAPSLTRATEALGPFSEATIPALTSLGDAAEQAGPDLVASDPVIRQIRGVAQSGKKATTNLAKLLTSLRKTDGYKQLNSFIFNSSGSVNAFDDYGHFLRALLPNNNCVDYETVPEAACFAFFYLQRTAATKTAKALEALIKSQAAEELERLAGGNGDSHRGDGNRNDAADGNDGSGNGASDTQASPQQGSAGPDAGQGTGELEPTPEPTPTEPGQTTTTPESGVDAAPSPQAGTSASPQKRKEQMRAAQDLLDFLIGERQRGGGR